MKNIVSTPVKEDIFYLKDIQCGINNLTKGKAKYIEGYQAEILNLGRSILIPHLHKLLNLFVKHGFPKPWMQRIIVPMFENGDKIIPTNQRTIMISHILDKLYDIILENKIIHLLKIHRKRAKGKDGFRR